MVSQLPSLLNVCTPAERVQLFEDGDLMTTRRQPDCRAQPTEPAPDNDDPCHILNNAFLEWCDGNGAVVDVQETQLPFANLAVAKMASPLKDAGIKPMLIPQRLYNQSTILPNLVQIYRVFRQIDSASAPLA